MHRTCRAASILVLSFACACAAPPPSAPAHDSDEGTSTGGVGSTGAGSSGSSGAPEAEPLPDPFELDRDNVRLLPFLVRHKRLQQLLGAAADDPAFAVLLARRYELGDYNHAQGINPDLTWTATRMSAWVAAMRPVCASPAMKARFPAFPDALDELLLAAYGTAPGPEDLAAYEDLLGDAAFDEAVRYELVCVAALSALDFVAR